jgi:hypothetical protein
MPETIIKVEVLCNRWSCYNIVSNANYATMEMNDDWGVKSVNYTYSYRISLMIRNGLVWYMLQATMIFKKNIVLIFYWMGWVPIVVWNAVS